MPIVEEIIQLEYIITRDPILFTCVKIIAYIYNTVPAVAQSFHPYNFSLAIKK